MSDEISLSTSRPAPPKYVDGFPPMFDEDSLSTPSPPKSLNGPSTREPRPLHVFKKRRQDSEESDVCLCGSCGLPFPETQERPPEREREVKRARFADDDYSRVSSEPVPTITQWLNSSPRFTAMTAVQLAGS